MLVASLLTYFVSLDMTVGGLILAANARWRRTPEHVDLVRAIRAAIPWTAAAWLVASGASLLLLSASGSPLAGRMVLPEWTAPGTLPRILHFLFAAPAVAGFAVAYASLGTRRVDPLFSRWLARHGLVWFVLCSAVNLPIGGAWLVKLPRPVLERLEGADSVAMAAISIAVIGAIFAVGFGALAAVLPEPRAYLHATAVSLVITLAAMVIVREQLRPASGAPLDAARITAAILLTAAAGGCLWLASSAFVRRRASG